MANTQPRRVKTIKEYHLLMGLPKPEHPLISVVHLESIRNFPVAAPTSIVFDFYSISLKRSFNGKMKYGQQKYDFDDGIMFFMAPGQVFGVEANEGEELKHSGWVLFVHPDFLWKTPLAKTIKQYEYFDYSVNEALFLSEKEREGLPTVQYIAQKLNISPNYLSELLKVLTGRSTRDHIHEKLMEKAKERLSTTDLSVSEIAYELGFEHPQSFSKLFKMKTSLSPLEFRQSFN